MNSKPTESEPKVIPLGSLKSAIVDSEEFERLSHYHWRAVKAHRNFYAKTTVGKPGNQADLSMHRLVAHTPFGQVCHHRNRNSLDNRRANLLNLDRYDHELLHRNNSLLIQYDPNYQGEPVNFTG